ncbi:recQ-mediated genome instability protein 1-like isoform X2 [Patiria miniata]|uniref:RecQ-mediated genome instability protein 1 n=1 Tax=Patiria miniata TaxID=46514 RepID=A0A913Z8Q3_PATMI|nr:recQ-mediated genome instability protein 1-like isoform X2 [Patiria miniata]
MALQVPEVTAFLRSRHVQVVDEWTVECLDWLQQEYQGQNVKPNEMKQYVYDQWLDSDLTEIASPALPPGIAQQRKTQLTGSYVLQINSVQDISTPAYGQLIKLQGKENENVLVTATQATQQTQSKFEQKSSRMLMLQLTDGHQSLEGMEYQPISQLSVNILPGTKILVHGSVQCRMGVLMLTANNVRVLGGDAESLAENNSQIQILSRALGLDGSQQSQQEPVPAASNQRQPAPQSPIDLTGDSEIIRNTSSSTGRSNHNKQRASHVNEEDGFFSDDLGEDLDALMLNEIERIEEMDQIQQLASSAGEETEWPADEEEIDEMWLEQVEQNHDVQSTDLSKQNATTKNKSNSAPVITRTAPNISTLNQVPQQSRQAQKDAKVKTEPFAARQGNVKQPTLSKINLSSVNSLTSVRHQDLKMESKRPDKEGLGNVFKTNMPDSKGAFSRTKDEPSANRSTNVSSNTKIGNNPRTSDQHAHRDIPSKANLDSKKTLDYKVPTVPQFLKNKETAGPETKPLVDFQQKAQSSEPSTSSSDPITNFLNLRTGVAKPAPATGIAARITKEPPQGKWDNNAKISSLAATVQSSTSGSEDTETSFEEGLSAAKRRRFRSNEGGWADRGMASSSIVALSSVMGRIQAQDIFTFTIKGFVVTLISALSKNDGHWSISAKISDKSATLDVDLSNEVLTGLIGFSVTEMIQLKKTIKTSDPVKAKELETKLRQGLAQCQKSLINMHCTLTVQVRSNQERPLVIAVGKTDPADLATNFREVPGKS